jgi:hypothetical protein
MDHSRAGSIARNPSFAPIVIPVEAQTICRENVDMTMIAKGSGGILAGVLTVASITLAQAQAPDPKGCTPQERSSQALSQDANKNAGVICPPDIDPAMKAPTPKTGDPSVIPPPSASDPSAQPK